MMVIRHVARIRAEDRKSVTDGVSLLAKISRDGMMMRRVAKLGEEFNADTLRLRVKCEPIGKL